MIFLFIHHNFKMHLFTFVPLKSRNFPALSFFMPDPSKGYSIILSSPQNALKNMWSICFFGGGDCMFAVPPNQNRFVPKLLTSSKAFYEHRTAVAISPANVPGTWSSENPGIFINKNGWRRNFWGINIIGIPGIYTPEIQHIYQKWPYSRGVHFF